MDTNSLMNPARRISLKVLTSLWWSRITPRMLPVDIMLILEQRQKCKCLTYLINSSNIWWRYSLVLFWAVWEFMVTRTFTLNSLFLKRNKNTFIPFLLHTLHLNYGSHQWLHQLLSKRPIIFSINEFVHRMSENNENCPSEPHATSTVGNANILRWLSYYTNSILFWKAWIRFTLF